MKQTFYSLIQLALVLIVVSGGGEAARAAQVGPAGYTNGFGTQPPAVDWSTFSIPGASADLGSAGAIDMAVLAVSASSITAQVQADPANPAPVLATATWSAAGLYLQTRPTGNQATLLMCTLVNNLGGDAVSVTVSYDVANAATSVEQVDGWRAYYSLSGALNSWVLIPSLTTATPGRPSATLAVNWPGGSPLYIVWADDNADGGTEGIFQLDNFSATAAAAAQVPASIASQPQNLTVDELFPASFSVGVGGNPAPTIQWYSNDVAIPNATNLTYAIASTPLHFHGLNFRAVAVNTASNVTYSVTSDVAVLTVNADLMRPSLLGAVASGSIQVVASFSERLTPQNATNTGNYSVTGPGGGLTISNAFLDASQTNVVLTVTTLTPGTTYTLTVSGVTDLAAAANVILPGSQAMFTAATYTGNDIGGPAGAGSAADAGNGFAVTGGGTNILGVSDQFFFNWRQFAGDFDLKVRVENFTGSEPYAKAGLMARETLVANSKFASSFATPHVSGSFFSQRINTGANVVNGGFFPVAYPNTWLRLRRSGAVFTGFAGVDGQNWVQLGTVTLTTPASVFHVGMAVTGVAPSNNPSATVTAQFRDLGDGSGGVIGNVTLPFEPLGPSSRNTGLIISEIMYHPKPSNGLEFIEIFNAGLIDEDIGGYRIAGDVDYVFPSNTVLSAGGFLVVARNPAALQAVSGFAGALGPWIGASTNALPDDEGTVRLRNRAGAVLLEVIYEGQAPWPLAADGTGHSLVLARPSYGEADPRAWSASDVMGGSPGRSDGYGADPLRNVVINEFLAHTDLPLEDYIELYNHSTQPVDISGAYLSDDRDTNKFKIPNETILPARGFKAFTVNTAATGFSLSSGGERIYFVNPAQTRVLDMVVYEAQANAVSSGRHPDGAPAIQPLSSRTPDTTNTAPILPDVVINELMFNPISGDDDDEFVELYNRSGTPVDLGNWRFTAGISYTFPANTILASNGYLIVAKDKARLLPRYLQLNNTNTLGDYNGALANGGERVALSRPDYFLVTNNSVVTTQANYIVVTEITYVDSGRWARWADGGGSSLELMDPNSDNSLPANWADSDETSKGAWTNISVSARADHVYPVDANGPLMNEVQVMLLGAGEALMDDVNVQVGTGGGNLVANPGFTSGLTSWTIQGNHVRSVLEPVGPNNPSPSLRIVATAGGDNGANRVESPLSATLTANTTNTIGGRFRWLRGFPIVLLRVHGGGLEAVGTLPTPPNLGSPGQVNSRRVANAGPAIYDVAHAPVLPEANQPILFTARVTDPGGIASVQLRYRLDPSATVNTLALNDNGTGGDAVAADGLYSATLIGQSAGALVAFRVQATDGAAAVAQFPDATMGEALVRVGDPQIFGNLGVYRMWMTTSNINLWTTRERLSNQAIDGTFVHGNVRAIYNSAARYRGSPFTRNPSSPAGVGVAANYVWTLPDDQPYLGTDELNLDCLEPGGSSNVRDVTALREVTAFDLLNQMDLPFSYQRYVHIVINGITSASRNIPVYTDSQQPNGEYTAMWFPDDNDGDLFKIDDWFEFDATPARQGNKSASLENFLTDGGVKKQARYRWCWEKKANRGLNDDYSGLYAGVDALNAPDAIYVRELEANFEIREWLTALAFRHVIGDWDGYGYQRGKNQFCYRPRDGKLSMLMWDIDFALGCNSGHAPSQDLFTVSTGGATASDNMPEVSRLYNHPHTRRMYLQALHQMATGPMQDANFLPGLDARYRALLANGVASGLTSPFVASGAQSISVPAWIQQRRAFILGASGVGNFLGATFRVFTTNNIVTNGNVLLITGSAPLGVRDVLVNGAAWPVTWTSVTSWTARVVINPGTNAIALTGLDFNGSTITTTQTVVADFTGSTPSPAGLIVFNEIMPNPSVPDADFVEIVNTSAHTYDIGGWRVNGLDYSFPTGTILTNGQFLVLVKNLQAFYAVHGTNTPNLFAEFDGNLDRDGETLTLLKPGNEVTADLIIDMLRYEARLPWASTPAGTSLELVDNAEDNSRSSAWAVQPGGGLQPAPSPWVRVTRTNVNLGIGTNLLFFLTTPGGCYLDDISLTLTNPGSPNIAINGDFEDGTTAPWILGTNYAGSMVVSNLSHSGTRSLLVRGGSSAGLPLTSTAQQFISQHPNYLTNAIYNLTYWIAIDTNPVTMTIRTVPGANIVGSGTTFVPVAPPPIVVASPGLANAAVLTNLPPYDPLWLNELLAQNTAGILDNAGEREPWLELYNGGTNVLSLDGYYLADNYNTNLTQWPFPPGHSIAPGKFLVVWADGETNETSGTNLHTSFRLNQTTGSVALVRLVEGAPQITDYLTYGGLGANLSYGDFPDGQPITRKIFQAVTPRGTNVARGINVFINEWMASNTNSLSDPTDGNFDDWFELYNASDVAVDLGDYYLTDNTNNRTQFRIPNNGHYVIPPFGFLLVWADNDSSDNSVDVPDLHVSFALSKGGGESLGLYGPDGTTRIDSLAFGPQTDNVSEGRFSDGASARFFMTNATPRAPNQLVTGNSAPTLDPIPNRVIRLGQSVNFTAMGSDPDAPPQVLAYTFGLTPPLGANLTSGGAFSWTPSAGQAPGTNSFNITVTDDGVPPRSAAQGFIIIVLPPPVAGISNDGGGNVSISFDTIPGRNYRVEYKNNLDDGTWLPLAPDTLATGPTLTILDNIGAQPHRFYQIVEVN